VFFVQPAKRHAYAQSGNNVFVPVERELIFDIVRNLCFFSFPVHLICACYILVQPLQLANIFNLLRIYLIMMMRATAALELMSARTAGP
jgi:hypothetical protein